MPRGKEVRRIRVQRRRRNVVFAEVIRRAIMPWKRRKKNG